MVWTLGFINDISIFTADFWCRKNRW